MSENKRSLHVVLFEPEIPPNTGNLIRLCANTGVALHLVEPLGFSMETKALRRAGLDYHESAAVMVHANIQACFDALKVGSSDVRVFAVSTKGSVAYSSISYRTGDVLLFGPETRGLPDTIRHDPLIEAAVRIPMQADSRSLNLSNSAAIIVFEALRQLEFPGLN